MAHAVKACFDVHRHESKHRNADDQADALGITPRRYRELADASAYDTTATD